MINGAKETIVLIVHKFGSASCANLTTLAKFVSQMGFCGSSLGRFLSERTYELLCLGLRAGGFLYERALKI